MRNASVSSIDELVSNLAYDTRLSAQDIGFLDGTIENKTVNKKIGGSYAGNAADIAIRAVVSKVVLYIYRTLETNGDSLGRFLREAPKHISTIEDRYRKRVPDLPSGQGETDRINKSILELNKAYQLLIQSAQCKWILVHRDERLGHSLRGKGGVRKKLSQGDVVEVEPTYDDVLDVAKETTRLAMTAYLIWESRSESPLTLIKLVSKQTHDFWRLMPILKDVE